MISRDEILNGQEKQFPLTSVMEGNLSHLLDCLNKFRQAYGKPMVVSSGYRPPEHNAKVGGAPNSCHLTCEATDFKDKDGELKKWCLSNLPVLESCGLYMEHQDATPTWCHLQTRMPASGHRVFRP